MNLKRSIVILVLAALLGGAWGCVVHPRHDYYRGRDYDRYDSRYRDYDYRGPYRYYNSPYGP